MSSLLQDVRFALRQGRSRPGFTLVVILVLALGLGANAAIFTVVNATLLQRLPIIGICGDVVISLDDRPRPTMYQPMFDGNWSDFYAVVHTAGDPQGLGSAVRAEINSLDSNLPVFDLRTMQDILHRSAEHRQFTALLIGCFALLALVLAAVGLYGVLFYIVAQRTNEIGIRMVLGATLTEVRRLVLWQGMQPCSWESRWALQEQLWLRGILRASCSA